MEVLRQRIISLLIHSLFCFNKSLNAQYLFLYYIQTRQTIQTSLIFYEFKHIWDMLYKKTERSE